MIPHGLETDLRSILSRPAVVVAVGNALRGDDGFGPAVARTFRDDLPWPVVEAESAPENFLEPILRHDPDTVLILDAAAFGGTPGELRLLRAKDAASGGISTHSGPPARLAHALQRGREREVWILAVQAETVRFGAPMSDPVRLAVNETGRLLSRISASRGHARRGQAVNYHRENLRPDPEWG